MKHTFTVQKPDTLYAFLQNALPQTTLSFIKAQCKKGETRVNGAKTKQNAPLAAGDTVEIFLPQNAALPPIKTVFEDDTILIADKPPHMESETQLPAVLLKTRGLQTYAVHRLDVNTTGLLILAKTAAARDALIAAFAAGQVHKTYAARVFGCPPKPRGEWRGYLAKNARTAYCTVTDTPQKGSREIVTRYEVAAKGEQSLLWLHPVTGRTHQLRAQTAHAGIPIVGDDKYGNRAKNRAAGAKRQLLRAVALRFGTLSGVVKHLSGQTFAVPTGEELLQGAEIKLTYAPE